MRKSASIRRAQCLRGPGLARHEVRRDGACRTPRVAVALLRPGGRGRGPATRGGRFVAPGPEGEEIATALGESIIATSACVAELRRHKRSRRRGNLIVRVNCDPNAILEKAAWHTCPRETRKDMN